MNNALFNISTFKYKIKVQKAPKLFCAADVLAFAAWRSPVEFLRR